MYWLTYVPQTQSPCSARLQCDSTFFRWPGHSPQCWQTQSRRTAGRYTGRGAQSESIHAASHTCTCVFTHIPLIVIVSYIIVVNSWISIANIHAVTHILSGSLPIYYGDTFPYCYTTRTRVYGKHHSCSINFHLCKNIPKKLVILLMHIHVTN